MGYVVGVKKVGGFGGGVLSKIFILHSGGRGALHSGGRGAVFALPIPNCARNGYFLHSPPQ